MTAAALFIDWVDKLCMIQLIYGPLLNTPTATLSSVIVDSFKQHELQLVYERK